VLFIYTALLVIILYQLLCKQYPSFLDWFYKGSKRSKEQYIKQEIIFTYIEWILFFALLPIQYRFNFSIKVIFLISLSFLLLGRLAAYLFVLYKSK